MPSMGPSSIGVTIEDVETPTTGHDGGGAAPRGLRILMKDLAYHVASNKKRGERAYLLKGISAFLEPGQMTALMGPSGSGKTTLLDLLAGRKTVGRSEGHLSFAGMQPSMQFLRRYTGYVEQFDTLIGDLTVREMLLYTAELKRPVAEPLAEKRREVDALLKRLALDSCADVKIGNALTKGISGGQAKRTNIGIALISNPRVLFLDEPTSGLDSYTSNEVMELVQGLTADGTTIVATIHSPTAATFALFDRVMLLVRGQLVYFGPQGARAEQYMAEEWAGTAQAAPSMRALSRAASVRPGSTQGGSAGAVTGGVRSRFGGRGAAAAPAGAPSCVNDAELLIEAVTEADHRGEADKLAAVYQRSGLCQENEEQLEIYMAADAAGGDSPLRTEASSVLATRTATSTPWYWAFWVLIKYRTSHNYRNFAWLGPRLADKTVISLIILTLYLGIGDNLAPDNLINLQSALFMWALLPAFGAMPYVPAIVLERRLFLRERADGLYAVFPYLAAKWAEELFLVLLVSLAFSAYVFHGLQLLGQWVVFWLVYFMDVSVGIVVAYLVAAISPNMDVANAALPGFIVTLLFFAGQLMLIEDIPPWWQWYSRIDFIRYAWAALMQNQFGENDVPFAGDMSILEYYGLAGVNMWANIGYLAIFWGVFATLAFLALSFVRFDKR